jgi:hypothetical protein
MEAVKLTHDRLVNHESTRISGGHPHGLADDLMRRVSIHKSCENPSPQAFTTPASQTNRLVFQTKGYETAFSMPAVGANTIKNYLRP